MLGSRVTAIAYPMLVLYLTGSPVDAGLMAFAATAPSMLVYLPAGALVDRWDPRRVMLVSESGRGLAIAGVVAMVAMRWHSFQLLVTAAVVEEILEVFSALAERRYVGSVVERDRVSSALVGVEARTHVVILAGRPLGGLLFELAPIVPFLVDVLTFAFSVGALLGIRSAPAPGRAAVAPMPRPRQLGRYQARRAIGRLARAPGRFRSDIREGLEWLALHRFARSAMVLSASTTLISQALIMVFIADAHDRQSSSITVGAVLAMSGLGGALGSALASKLRIPATHSLIKTQMVGCSAVFLVLAISGWRYPLGMALVMACLGFMGAMGNIEAGTYIVQNAEDKLARVTSIDRLMSFSACAIGPLVGGFLFQQFGIHVTVGCLLAMTAVATLYSIVTPSMRASGRLGRLTGDNQEICAQTAR
jgi:MFS family permease